MPAYYAKHDEITESEHPCRKCPLYSILGTSKDHDDVGCSVPYETFCEYSCPEEMIKALKKAVKLETKTKTKTKGKAK